MRAWILVFSSALRMRSSGSRRSSRHSPAYRSSTRPALGANCGSRGKIQCSYRHGLMASASRIRPTVRRLIGLPRASRARPARSVSDCRLKGSLVWATVSQARALTIASSRGGRGGLAPTPGPVFQGPIALRPTPAPVAYRVGVQLDEASGLDVGQRGVLVEQQDQGGALA